MANKGLGLGFPTKKCNNPGGDCSWGADPSYMMFYLWTKFRESIWDGESENTGEFIGYVI